MSDSVVPIQLFTIGFTGKSAETFFKLLISSGVRKVIDVRLNNVSQLAGFTKRRDLQYFLEKIGSIDYFHDIRFAPTKDILDKFKMKGQIPWEEYEIAFNSLLTQRQPAQEIDCLSMDRSCLLCSEVEPIHCHRRLVAEYLKREWINVTITHL